MAEAAKDRTRATVEAVPDPSETGDADRERVAARSHGSATCPVAWCPICLAVTAVQPVNPEVVEHLLKAGTEFFLALRSLIDARADDLGSHDDDGSDGDLHKIDIG